MGKPTYTYTIRLTEGNPIHKEAIAIVQEWEARGWKPQEILLNALIALEKRDLPAHKKPQADEFAEIARRLWGAVERLQTMTIASGQVPTPEQVQEATQGIDLPDDFVNSVLGYFEGDL